MLGGSTLTELRSCLLLAEQEREVSENPKPPVVLVGSRRSCCGHGRKMCWTAVSRLSRGSMITCPLIVTVSPTPNTHKALLFVFVGLKRDSCVRSWSWYPLPFPHMVPTQPGHDRYSLNLIAPGLLRNTAIVVLNVFVLQVVMRAFFVWQNVQAVRTPVIGL